MPATSEQHAVKLTSFSHGAGCGCKIAPQVLDEILRSTSSIQLQNSNLLVGNDTRDDAAVYDLGNGQALISTTDFFMPIVDDPYDFGRIASANALSDVYAMGGRPILAIAILGWPIGKLDTAIAAKVLDGSRAICAEAGISLAGGHSIDTEEPIFGLAVNGLVPISNLKKNSTATAGCLLYLSKRLGVGIISTAQKQGMLRAQDALQALDSMTRLNQLGELAGTLDYVKAMTDVTGFGLLGHLLEMCAGSGLQATLNLNAIQVMSGLDHYLEEGCVPGGTKRNLAGYENSVSPLGLHEKYILADPQTSGGLLIAVEPAAAQDFESFMLESGIDAEFCKPIGALTERRSSHTTIITVV